MKFFSDFRIFHFDSNENFRELDQLFPFSLWFHAMISSIRRTMGNIVFDTRQFFQNVSRPPSSLIPWVESLGAFENSFALVSVSFICLFIYFYFLLRPVYNTEAATSLEEFYFSRNDSNSRFRKPVLYKRDNFIRAIALPININKFRFNKRIEVKLDTQLVENWNASFL